jgi:hypothetical protein
MSNNRKALEEFTRYCEEHPQERFWQALRNWTGYSFILVTNQPVENWHGVCKDTFFWKGKYKYE